MTAFPIQLHNLTALDELDKPARRSYFDALTEETRSRTPAAAVEQRAQPRLSTSELNSLDWDAVRERFQKQRYDTRGPVTKFLDLLDLPRNTIVSTVFPSIEKKKRLSGEIGTAGRGVVRFSDVLEELGVENRLIRGIVGFAGDVATDPLTYLGPPGWGFEAASKGAAAARTTKRGLRELKDAMEAVRSGRAVADPDIARALRAAKLDAEGVAARVASGDNIKDVHGEVGRFIFGGKRSTLNKMARVLGADRSQPGGWLAENLWKVANTASTPEERELIESAGGFMSRHGRQAQPGVRIGRNAEGKLGVEFGKPGVKPTIEAGSQIAHIPFTDYAISVPGFTKAAQLARAQGLAAGALRVERDGITPVDPASRVLQGIVGEMETIEKEHKDLLQGYKQIDEAEKIGVYDPESIGEMRRSLSESIDRTAARHAELATQAQYTADAAKSNKASTPADILYQGQLARAANDQRMRFVAEQRLTGLESEELGRLRDEVRSDLQNYTRHVKDVVPEEAARAEYIAKLDEKSNRLLDMSDEELSKIAQYHKLVEAKVDAQQRLASTLKSPLLNFTDDGDRALRDLAAVAVGLSPDEVPMHGMGTIGTAFAHALGFAPELRFEVERAMSRGAEGLRRAFGSRGGRINDLERIFGRFKTGSMEESIRLSNEFLERRNALVAKYGIQDSENLGRLMTAMATEMDNKLVGAKNDATVQAILDAAHAGIFQNKELLNDLNSIVEEMRAIIDQVGTADVQAGILGNKINQYGAGNIRTREAKQLARFQNRNVRVLAGESGRGAPIEEPFTRQRSTLEHTWVDKDGNEKSFYEGERYILQFSPKEMDSLGEAGKQERARLEALIAEYNKLPKSKVTSRYISALEFNQRVKDGRAAMLHGGALKGKDAPNFFVEDFIHAFADRLGQSERAHYNKYLAEELLPHGLTLNEGKIAKVWTDPASQGKVFELGSGVRGRVDKTGGKEYLWIGGRRYRKVNPEAGENLLYNPLTYTDDNRMLSKWYPEEVADLIEKAVVPFKEENVPVMLQALDTFTKIWKGQTLLHPSWIIGNMSGNMAFALNLGANLQKVAKHARTAWKIVRNRDNAEELAKITVDVAGRPMTGLDILSGVPGSVLKQGPTDEAIIHLMQNGVYTPGMARLLSKNTLKDPIGAVRNKFDELSGEAQRRMRASMEASIIDKLPHGGKIRQGGIMLSDAAAQTWGTFAKFNAKAEEWIRTATFLALLDDGMEPTMAARKIADGMLDFSNLTKTDVAIRRWIPFWMWLKNSTIHGLNQVIQNPKWFTIAPHAIDAIEEGVNGENNLPRHLRPRWMNEQLAIMIGKDPERFAVSVGSLHPAEGATKFLAGFASPALGMEAAQDLVTYFGNSFNPLLKAVMELTAGQEFYTHRTISARPDEGDLSVDEYLTRQIRPVRELGLFDVRRAPIATAAERSPLEGAARAIIGGRIQPASDERLSFQKRREFADAVRAVRKRTNLAEREGASSTRSRARELAIYKAMLDSGLEKDVPLWARDQLAQLAGSR